MNHNITLFILFILFNVNAWSQTGAIEGVVTDLKTGDPLIGVYVQVIEKGEGVSSGMEGDFLIEGLEPGTYSLKFSYISFEEKVVEGVQVQSGQTTTKNVTLKEEGYQLEGVSIKVKGVSNTEAGLLSQQKKASSIQDGISSEQISRSGDNDAGSAVKRVTGVTVEDGKYVYIRGLGDRYSKSYLNMSEIPSLDPDRNSVQMDIFPTILIDNMNIFKAFSPDLPGSFAGGVVDVQTKNFPDKLTIQTSHSFRYNANATFNPDFLTHKGGKLDWLGMDDGSRSIPAEVENGLGNPAFAAGGDQEALNKVDKATRSFNHEMYPTVKTPLMNQNHSFSIGGKTKLFGKTLGMIGGINYQRKYTFYENGETGRYRLSGSTANQLSPLFLLNDSKSTESMLGGVFLNTGLKLNRNHELSLNLIRNQSSNKVTRFQSGQWREQGTFTPNEIYESRWLQFIERQMNVIQMKGEHELKDLNNLEIDWVSAVTFSKQEEPDLRMFTNDFEVTGEDTVYQISLNAYQKPARYYRSLDETNIDNKLNITYPFTFREEDASFKFGGAYTYKSREFIENRYDYNPGNDADPFNGSVAAFISDDNIGKIGENGLGVHMIDATDQSNSYTGEQSVSAVYGMVNLSPMKHLTVITGARVEKTDIEVISANPSQPRGLLDDTDILPSLNVKYEAIEDMNIRTSYGRTLARPTFRELAPYGSFNFAADFVLIGNENLQRTLIDNFDIRWEYYPNPGEILAVSPFYKRFTNPIVVSLVSKAANREQKYENVEEATVAGIELEVRKNLEFISPSLSNMKIGTNVSLIDSRVNIDPQELERIRSTDPDADDYRQLFGQSPYIINSYLSYQNDSLGLSANLTYNVFGPRIVAISQGGLPDVYEQPRGMLNIRINKNISKQFTLNFSANNLLNPEYKMTHEFKGEEYIYQNYRLGRSFSLGISYNFDPS